VTHVDELEEMRAMLADRIQEWTEEAKREGFREGFREAFREGLQKELREGLREGQLKGLQEGEARLLLRLLVRRFGDLPQCVRDRVQQADVSQLERWGERLLDARTLTDLFGQGSSG
jgi:flagellar biosynthesis/type III secretory pathway protein FliH